MNTKDDAGLSGLIESGKVATSTKLRSLKAKRETNPENASTPTIQAQNTVDGIWGKTLQGDWSEKQELPKREEEADLLHGMTLSICYAIEREAAELA